MKEVNLALKTNGAPRIKIDFDKFSRDELIKMAGDLTALRDYFLRQADVPEKDIQKL